MLHSLWDAVASGAQPQGVDLVLLVHKLKALLQLRQVVAKVLGKINVSFFSFNRRNISVFELFT